MTQLIKLILVLWVVNFVVVKKSKGVCIKLSHQNMICQIHNVSGDYMKASQSQPALNALSSLFLHFTDMERTSTNPEHHT